MRALALLAIAAACPEMTSLHITNCRTSQGSVVMDRHRASLPWLRARRNGPGRLARPAALAAAGDAVGESPEGRYLQHRVAVAGGFVEGDVDEGPAASSRNVAYRSPVGWVWCSSS